MAQTLDAGDKRSGIFIHSESDDAPFVAGVLWLDERQGITAEIPYIPHVTNQFDTPARWFSEQKPPANLLFRSEGLNLSLFDCSFSRTTSGTYISVGGLRAADAVLYERVADIDEPLRVSVVMSQIDGLQDWTRLRSGEWTSEWLEGEGGGKRRVTYTIEQKDGLRWQQGGARMMLTTHWRSDSNAGPGVHLDDAVVLVSKFRRARPVLDHLVEHWKFRNLLALIHGSAAYYRRHEIRDKSFPYQTLDGKTHGAENHQLLSRRTVAEHSRPAPEPNAFHYPILRITDLSADALTRWARQYDSWNRIILPAASLLHRNGLYGEDIVINASMSIEALGQSLPTQAGERATYSRKRPTTATNFFRVIRTIGLDTSKIAPSDEAVARALANIYNTVKHADRGGFPDGLHTYFAGKLSLLLARIGVLKLLTNDDATITRYVDSWGVGALIEHMNQANVSINAKGEFVH